MSTLLNISEVKDLIRTDFSDGAINALIDREEGEIVRRFGPNTGSITDIFDGVISENIWVDRRIDSVTSVEESTDNFVTIDLLTSTEFRVFTDEGRIQRLSSGFKVKFEPDVRVIYTPVDDQEERKAVLIELVRVGLERQVMIRESVGQGDYAYEAPNWEDVRRQLYTRLRPFAVVSGA